MDLRLLFPENNKGTPTANNRALEKGLILINAGADIIRFVPPLVITRENVDEMIAILDTCIE